MQLNFATVTAEDLICFLSARCNYASSVDGSGFSKHDANFGHSLAAKVKTNPPWSEKQANAAIKLITKYKKQFGDQVAIENWLKNPIFKYDTNTTAQSKKQLISIDNDAVFEFSYNLDIILDIKNIKGSHKGVKFWPKWDPDNKSWKVAVNESSIGKIIHVAEKHSFEIEERFNIFYSKVQKKLQDSNLMLNLNENQHVNVVEDKILIYINDPEILSEFEKELLNV